MKIESFEKAKPKIISYLYENKIGAFTFADITKIFNTKNIVWEIASYRRVKHFIDFLIKNNILELVKLKHLTKGNLKQIFIVPGTGKFNIAQTIKKDGYLCYYSSLQMHQLTLQNSKSVYIGFDKIDAYFDNSHDPLEQEAIDNAFSKPQRQTSEIYKSEINDLRYFLIQKKVNSIEVGISKEKGIRYTDLERTLIDVAIRPSYSGGVFEVLEAYENAKEKLDPIKMFNYLDGLDYIYPYFQLVGFYLDKAGYSKEEYKLFYERKSSLKFYLTYSISNKKFDEKWNIYYPNGF